jgi:hypothetical protein
VISIERVWPNDAEPIYRPRIVMPKPSMKSKQETLVAPDVRPKRQDAAKKRREGRMRAYERNKRQWMITKISAAIIGLAIIAGVAYLIVNNIQEKNDNKVPDGVVSYSNTSRAHDDTFNAWTEVPPTGGTHNNIWQTCQYYSAPIDPGKGVHSMEHGAVWITYSPDLPQVQVDKLKELADGQDYILVSPYIGLPSPVVASAWNKQLKLESADDGRLEQFIRVYKNSPDNTPEYGASCESGSTDTVG